MNLLSCTSRTLPVVLFASLAYGGVIFSPDNGCVATPTQGDVTGIKCYGEFQQSSSVSHTFSGEGSGTFTTDSIPFSYNFTVDRGLVPFSVSSAITGDWYGDISIQINSTAAGAVELQGLFGQQMTGTFNVQTPNGSALTSWRIDVFARNSGKSSSPVKLIIPEDSFDLPGGQSIPEPAAMCLVAAGLMAIGLYGRNRARR